MNLPASQLKKAIESLPNPESFPHSVYKVSLLKGPEMIPYGYDGPDLPIDVVELVFVKNSLSRHWDLKGISNVVSLTADLDSYHKDPDTNKLTADFEFEMFHEILFKLLKRVPLPDEVLLIEKKMVPNTGDRKMDVFFFGSKLGRIEYMANGMEFKPAKPYSYKS